MPSELTPFVFKDTGIQVMIKKVSPFLIMEVEKSFPPPEPPMQEVIYGDPDDPGAKRVHEPNESHPEYQKDLEEYETELEFKLRQVIIERGVVIVLDEEQKGEINELREYWKETFDRDIPLNDKMLYITHIAVGTGPDVEDLITAISSRSQPTEAETSLNKAGFQG